MERITLVDFDRFARAGESLCVSILMPTHTAGSQVRQDPIRFKNLLRDANRLLEPLEGGEVDSIREELESLRDLVGDVHFWEHQEAGMAAYLLPGETHLRSLPFSPGKRLILDRRCYMTPLVPVLSDDVRFYVLALSPKGIRLYECTRYAHREVDTHGWPESIEDMKSFIEERRELQFHTQTPSRGLEGERAAVFHGHQAGDDGSQRKLRLLEYCRLIDQRIASTLKGEEASLVLACDERLAPMFRETSSYPRILSRQITGNLDCRSGEELREDAWRFVEEEIEARREEAITRYESARGHSMATTGLEETLPAALDGRIDTLLVAGEAESWGRYDAQLRYVEIHTHPWLQDEPLVNRTLIESYLRGAALFVVPAERLPQNASTGAILRY